jgi:hypothetical protein
VPSLSQLPQETEASSKMERNMQREITNKRIQETSLERKKWKYPFSVFKDF